MVVLLFQGCQIAAYGYQLFSIIYITNSTHSLCIDRCVQRGHARTNHHYVTRDYAFYLVFRILRGYTLKVNYLQTEHRVEIFHLNLVIYYFFVVYGLMDKTQSTGAHTLTHYLQSIRVHTLSILLMFISKHVLSILCLYY